MSYTPTEWATGDTITAEKLNNIETGIAGLYPSETVIAPEQSVTITVETLAPVALTLVDGYTAPETLPEDWLVTMGDTTLTYDSSAIGGAAYVASFTYTPPDSETEYDGIYAVGITSVDGVSNSIVFVPAIMSGGDMIGFAPGTYTVSISIPASGETYEPTVWQTGDVITAEKLNKIEDALADLNGYMVIAEQQSVTYAGDDPALITLVEGQTVPINIPEDLMVFVDGNALEYSVGDTGYVNTDGQGYVYVFLWETDPEQHTYAYALQVYDGNDDPVPGTYSVKIYAPKSDVPAGYVVVAEEQSIVFESSPADITFVSGYTISSPYPSDWLVIVDDHELDWNSTDELYTATVDGVMYDVAFYPDYEVGEIYARLDVFENSVEKYGTYTVAIYAPENSGGGDNSGGFDNSGNK